MGSKRWSRSALLNVKSRKLHRLVGFSVPIQPRKWVLPCSSISHVTNSGLSCQRGSKSVSTGSNIRGETSKRRVQVYYCCCTLKRGAGSTSPSKCDCSVSKQYTTIAALAIFVPAKSSSGAHVRLLVKKRTCSNGSLLRIEIDFCLSYLRSRDSIMRFISIFADKRP